MLGPKKLHSQVYNMIWDQSDKKVYRCGRRIGITTTFAIEALHLALTKCQSKILIVEYGSEDQILAMANLIIDSTPKDTLTGFYHKNTIHFNNGSSIFLKNYLPNDNEWFKGNGKPIGFPVKDLSKVFINIQDLYPKSMYVEELHMSFPDIPIVVAGRPSLEDIPGTWYKEGSFFYRICNNRDLGWSQHWYPVTAEFSSDIKEEYSPALWKSEVEATFDLGEEEKRDKWRI